MPIPTYDELTVPFLKLLRDNGELPIKEIVERLADHAQLNDAERNQLLQSGQRIIANRVGWARTHLKKAGLIESPVRGRQRITQAGLDALAENPQKIDRQFLLRYPSFVEFIRRQPEDTETVAEEAARSTPEELLETSYQSLRNALADDLLDRVQSCSPQFFERLVVELLVAMGYGGSLADAGQAIGRSGDAGIDGIIKEDRLGLDVVCIQAKRWRGSVGRPEVQAFAGSMEGYRARKGVLITTAAFTRDAEEYVKHIERKIVLIDGEKLSQYMIDFGIGVSIANTYVVKRIDADYFLEDEG